MIKQLLESAATTVTGAPQIVEKEVGLGRTFQAAVAGTGVVSATVVIEVSNDGINFITLGTITLSGTNVASDGFTTNAAWQYSRARVSAISGTGATVNAVMGV